jgi:aryl-alcohol dehydrogenase-like predicted oxidoreductase
VDALRPIAERSGRSVGELALAWVLHRPEVTAAIVGGRRPGQARGLAAAADWSLSPRDMAEITTALAAREATA